LAEWVSSYARGHTDRQTDRPTDRPTDRQTDRQAYSLQYFATLPGRSDYDRMAFYTNKVQNQSEYIQLFRNVY